MSTLFFLLILLGILFFAVFFAGLFLPTTWVVEKAELINTSPSNLFPFINSLESWTNWSAWSSNNKELDFEFEYKDENLKEGLGAVQIWKSTKINGVLTITQSLLDEEIQYQLNIQEGNLVLIGTIVLAIANPNYTQIAWRCELKKLKNKNPIRRYQAFFLKNYFDTTIEESIFSLQSMFEANNSQVPKEI